MQARRLEPEVQKDTEIGGPQDRFRTTRWTAIAAAASDDPDERRRSFQVIVDMYWKPVYKYICIKWRKPNEDAKDLTQAFFARAFEKRWFSSYDPDRARFRTYLRTCLDGFLANEDKAGKRIKRGGGAAVLSLDFAKADGEMARIDEPADGSLDEYFEKEWVRSLFELALDRLRQECNATGKGIHLQLFECYDIQCMTGAPRPTYEDLAAEHDLSVTQVTNYLALARRQFRRHVLDKLREITGTEEEFRSEAQAILGVRP